jgi:sugar phosphate isomerase/epimerase
MIRLAFSTNAFKKNTLEEAIDAIAQIGYQGVELMADVPHAYPPSLDSTHRMEIKTYIAERGLAVSNVNAFTLFALGDTYHPTWIENDERQRELRIEHTMHCIELANQMECATVSLEPGGPLIGTGLEPAEAAQRFADGLGRLLPLAKRHGVVLAVEPEPGLLIQSAGEYLEFKRKHFADEQAIRMNCDVGHLFCVGEDPAAVIREMPAEVVHVHLEDIGENHVHQHLTPGKGAIDFPAIFAALDAIGYGGWATVELYPYETTAAGVARRAWKHLTPMLGSC